MNFDDETLLSAYLDDELDPADRMAVEWSVESSPPLAGRLRALATTRDSVAGLGRPPAPVDLGPILARRLAAARRPARPRILARAGVVMLAGGFASIAAGLIASMVLLHHATHDSGQPARPMPGPRVAEASVPEPTTDLPAPEAGPPLLARVEPARPDISPPSETVAPPEPARVDPGAMARERDDRDRIVGMLERPDVHRILVVTDVIDAGERIKSLIQRDVRKSPDFGRITVAEGIVIDPRHPGAAEVFTLVLENRECEPFLGKLARAFPKLVVEPHPGAGMLNQLAEVGQAAILPGLSVDSPDLPLVLAAKDDPPGARSLRDSLSGSFVLSDMEPFASAEGFPLFQEPEGDASRGGPARFPATPGPATLVVWVTRPNRR